MSKPGPEPSGSRGRRGPAAAGRAEPLEREVGGAERRSGRAGAERRRRWTNRWELGVEEARPGRGARGGAAAQEGPQGARRAAQPGATRVRASWRGPERRRRWPLAAPGEGGDRGGAESSRGRRGRRRRRVNGREEDLRKKVRVAGPHI